jgi:autotransporter-associated beta strand protein
MTIANNVFSSNNGMTGTGNLTITGNYTNSGANSKFQRTGYTTLAGNVYISENATSRTLQLSNNGTISGVISNGLSAPSSTITLSGASSTWVFSGNNTYTGQTNIQQGILSVSSIGNQTATGSNLSGGTVNFGVTSSTGQLTYTGTGETSNRTMAMIANTTGGAIIDQSGTGLLKLTANLSASGGGNSTRTLTLKGSTAGTGEFAGIIANQNSGNLTAVTKSGTGTWALSGNNSYTGATTVTAGTLLINGSTNAGSLVTVQTGGTLGGNGTIGGAVTVQNGGTLSPGNSPGLLTVASLTLDSGSTSFFQINGTTRVTLYDAVNVTGALSYNGTLSITFGGGYTPLVTDTFTLFNKGSYSGAFSTVTITNPSYAGTFNESTGILSLTAVPEPATWGLLAFSLTTVMVLRRRRNS